MAEIKESFKKYLTLLDKEFSSATVEVLDKGEIREEITGKDNEKVTRIIPKKSRINSKGEEIFDVDEEETNQISARMHSTYLD